MIKFLIKLFILAIVFFLTDIITYKCIRKIDKKEREKIDKYELEQVDKLLAKKNEVENGSNI